MLSSLQLRFLELFSPTYEALVDERKKHLFEAVRGETIEIGAGTCVNFRFLPADVRWVGVDPNARALPYVRKAAERAGRRFEFRAAPAEVLPFPDATFDCAISTLTLCSVRDPSLALAEIRRVLRPGGRFLFMEHVAAPAGSRTARRQRTIRPLFRCLAGCTPDRATGAIIREAGFAGVAMDEFVLPLPIVGPHICGCAIR